MLGRNIKHASKALLYKRYVEFVSSSREVEFSNKPNNGLILWDFHACYRRFFAMISVVFFNDFLSSSNVGRLEDKFINSAIS
jgi:hypothetical protein